MRRILTLGWLAMAGAFLPPQSPAAADDGPFALRDGDRVVLIGDAFLERDYEYGYLEATLTARLPDRDVQFRNLGRSGDTVRGDARAGFETPAEGFARRSEAVLGLDPTVIVAAYGMNESFDGEAGLSRFVEDLNRMLDSIETAKSRVVLVSPIVHERLGPPLPDPSAHNEQLRLYRDAMAAVAKERGLGFVDLIARRIGDGTRPERVAPAPETDDGIHLNAFGYWEAAESLARVLAPDTFPLWKVEARRGADRNPTARTGTTIDQFAATATGVRFRALDDRLPDFHAPDGTPDRLKESDRALRVDGLPAGRYTLTIDGKPFATADADAWAKGVVIGDCPERRQAEALRKAVLAKNEQFFHRNRPQNETYLFGFRKHEQGQNAAEVPKFDPLVADGEATIARLRRPVPHVYELTRED